MNDVAIIGTGQTKFSKEEADVEKLLFESANNCVKSISNCSPKDIDGVLVGGASLDPNSFGRIANYKIN